MAIAKRLRSDREEIDAPLRPLSEDSSRKGVRRPVHDLEEIHPSLGSDISLARVYKSKVAAAIWQRSRSSDWKEQDLCKESVRSSLGGLWTGLIDQQVSSSGAITMREQTAFRVLMGDIVLLFYKV